MDFRIRQAQANDSKAIAPLIVNAIGEIADYMTAESEPQKILQKLEAMIQGEQTRHSHRFTYAAEVNGAIAGILVLYHGKEAEALDRYLMEQLKKEGQPRTIEPEAHLDEWYIDTVSVDPAFQGQGIGTRLFEYAETIVAAHGGGKLALNVDIEKEGAIRLYHRLGFTITEPWTIIGEPFHHMVKIIS